MLGATELYGAPTFEVAFEYAIPVALPLTIGGIDSQALALPSSKCLVIDAN